MRRIPEIIKAAPTEAATVDEEGGCPGDIPPQPEIPSRADSGKGVRRQLHTLFEGREIRDPRLPRKAHPVLGPERVLLRKEKLGHRPELVLPLGAFGRNGAG